MLFSGLFHIEEIKHPSANQIKKFESEKRFSNLSKYKSQPPVIPLKRRSYNGIYVKMIIRYVLREGIISICCFGCKFTVFTIGSHGCFLLFFSFFNGLDRISIVSCVGPCLEIEKCAHNKRNGSVAPGMNNENMRKSEPGRLSLQMGHICFKYCILL